MEFLRCLFEKFLFNGNNILCIHAFFRPVSPRKVTQAVMLETCVRDGFCSILGKVSDDSERCLYYTQSLLANARMMP
jgi:hypothetical protein